MRKLFQRAGSMAETMLFDLSDPAPPPPPPQAPPTQDDLDMTFLEGHTTTTPPSETRLRPPEGVTSPAVAAPVVNIKDTRLQEIKDTLGGRWKLTRSDPYDEYLKECGIGYISRKLASNSNTELEVKVAIDMIMVTSFQAMHEQTWVMSLDQEMDNVVEKVRQGVVCTFMDGKLTVMMTSLEPGFTKMQSVDWRVNDKAELELVYACGAAKCRRYFTKVTPTEAT